VHHEQTGSGFPVLFIHEAIADSRMWEPQWRSFAGSYRLLRVDLAGFGRTPIERLPLTHASDVLALLDELGIEEAAVVGGSMGGRISLELAVARPDLVKALVLMDSGLPSGIEWSEGMREQWAAEDAAVARGDFDAAVEITLRMWVDGPRRQPSDVDPRVRAAVAEMQRRALELQAPHWEDGDEELLVPDVADRLGEVRAPTLVIVGEEDYDELQTIGRKLAAEIPDARFETIPGAAHIPSLERPELFDPLVLDFLANALS
jgi:pimeloyl-ACP methyl ester carboxylesterase